jgi:hypothetical protein
MLCLDTLNIAPLLARFNHSYIPVQAASKPDHSVLDAFQGLGRSRAWTATTQRQRRRMAMRAISPKADRTTRPVAR